MPQVPEYDGPRVGQAGYDAAPLGGAAAGPGSFGVGGVSQVGRVVEAGQEQLRQDAKDELDYAMQVAVVEQSAAFSGKELELRERLKKVKGLAATEEADLVLEDFDKFYAEQEKGIGNPIVKRAVGEKYKRHRDSLNSFALPYANAEVRRFDDQQSMANVKNLQDLARNNPFDVATVGDSIGEQMEVLGAYAKRNGLSSDDAKLLMNAARSETNLGVLESMLAQGENRAARQFFEMNRDGFIGESRTRAAQMVKNRGDLQEATDWADKALLAKTPTDSVAVLNGIEDADIQRQARAIYRDKKNLMEAAQEAEYAQNFNLAARAVMERGAPATSAQEQLRRPTEYQNAQEVVDPGVWNSLKHTERVKLDKLLKHAQGMAPIETSDRDYVLMKSFTDEQLGRMTNDGFMMKFRPMLADDDFKALAERRRQGIEGNRAKIAGFLNEEERALDGFLRSTTAKGAGVTSTWRPGKDSTPEQAAAYHAFRRLVDTSFLVSTASGKPLTDIERERLIGEAVMAFDRKYKLDYPQYGWETPFGLELPGELSLFSIEAKGIRDSVRPPKSVRSVFFRAMQSEGIAPLGVSEEDFMARSDIKSRAFRAYLARENGESLEDQLRILKGER